MPIMDIVFLKRKFEEECNTHKLLVKRYGKDRARRIERRLIQLRAAGVLEDLRSAPGRCHELKDNLAGVFSLDLDHPYRLLFKPAENPPPKKEDGGIDWKRVTSVIVLEVKDTHE
jgi:plasmid maintenance system killer protein